MVYAFQSTIEKIAKSPFVEYGFAIIWFVILCLFLIAMGWILVKSYEAFIHYKELDRIWNVMKGHGAEK